MGPEEVVECLRTGDKTGFFGRPGVSRSAGSLWLGGEDEMVSRKPLIGATV